MQRPFRPVPDKQYRPLECARLRAWRPVLLDAGHIVETVSLFLARRGLDVQVFSPPPATGEDPEPRTRMRRGTMVRAPR